MNCCFCKKEIEGFGNNAEPLREEGIRCCDKCNQEVIIPARIALLMKEEKG